MPAGGVHHGCLQRNLLDLHFILDDYATHKHVKVKAWLDRHPRVHFHFVPPSSSCLNLVERFVSELTQRPSSGPPPSETSWQRSTVLTPR